MTTAYELLMSAPESQVRRSQLAFKAVAAGQWADAASFMRNAAIEECGSEWAAQAEQFAQFCEQSIKKVA